METVILTGLSGAGKSHAVNTLEDVGYYCVDNVPPQMVEKFAEFCLESGGKTSKLALVADIRSGSSFSELLSAFSHLRSVGYKITIVFLDASDEVLIHRYKETRRKHPLLSESGTDSLENAIKKEREFLKPLRNAADYILDTSLMSAKQLSEWVISTFSDSVYDSILVTCTSFGYKFGIPADADLVFDVRCLPNPFYIPELKEKNGLDRAVNDFVFKWEQSGAVLQKLFDLIDYLLPLYIEEGKSQLTVAIGCTGGKHRSVAFTEHLADHLRKNGIKSVINHRDILKTMP